METRISNSRHSNQVPQGVDPEMIRKPGLRVKTNFRGGMRNRFLSFKMNGGPLQRKHQFTRYKEKHLNSAPPTSSLSRCRI